MVRLTPQFAERSARRLPRRSGFVVTPYIIRIDNQEQAEWTFQSLHTNAADGYRPIIVKTEKTAHIETGDYSIVGLEDRVVIERKSLEDLCGSMRRGRERLEAEHKRMQQIVAAGGEACLIVEASPADPIPPPIPEEARETVLGTWLSWGRKYGVPWLWAGDRRTAEEIAFRFLDSFWKRHNSGTA